MWLYYYFKLKYLSMKYDFNMPVKIFKCDTNTLKVVIEDIKDAH